MTDSHLLGSLNDRPEGITNELEAVYDREDSPESCKMSNPESDACCGVIVIRRCQCDESTEMKSSGRFSCGSW